MIKVDLVFYGFLQMIVGQMNSQLFLPQDSHLNDVWRIIREKYPRLDKDEVFNSSRVLVNGTFVDENQWNRRIIGNGDRIEFFCMVAGG